MTVLRALGGTDRTTLHAISRTRSTAAKISPPALPSRNLELDFLRGVAILMVVDFHSPARPLFAPFRYLGFAHFGWAGVDVFFVLSGFLIGGLLMQEWKTHGRIHLSRFLVRRCFKVMPQYYLYLAVILLTGHRHFQDLIGNLLNIQNYTHGIPHTWSLAVEEHAYLLLGLLLLGGTALRASARSLFMILAALTAAVHLLRLVLAIHGYPVQYATHTRIDGIFSGFLLAMLVYLKPLSFARLRHVPWLWCTLLTASLLFLRFQPKALWAQALAFDAANLLGLALLMLLYRRPPPLRLGRVYRGIAWIGVYSYGIYLWHVSTLAPIAWIGLHLPPVLAFFWNLFMPLVAAIALGSAMTQLVELPVLRLRNRWFPGFANLGSVLSHRALASDIGGKR